MSSAAGATGTDTGTRDHDVIVVGGRCAGAPTAMLLARLGHRVLLVDRATFPSDTISTHLIHPPGLAALERWGLLDRVVETGCPPIDTYAFDLGPFTITGSPAGEGFDASYAPRRTVLDEILIDAAAESGAEVRQGFTVEEILTDGDTVTGIKGHGKDGRTVTEYARFVVGADGLHSSVAKAVGAVGYAEKPKINAYYYTYWSGLPMRGTFEAYDRGDRAFAAWPTNDDLTLLICAWPMRDFEANRADVEGNYRATLALAPAFAERVSAATRAERFLGMAIPNYFRKPYGPGWVLVGDAGYLKDPITAQGIQDAFRDAERCARALGDTLDGRQPFDEAMRATQEARDAQVMSMYEFTAEFATLEPPPPEMEQLLLAVSQSPSAQDEFARVTAGVTPPEVFFGHMEERMSGHTGNAA
ncbi:MULTISPECIES: NAD(P)/FAD-dependent oxidoreductase [unclassified Streptomyces]|uniref:NAD(P)/FAD-dependent oxidoreductase n=1 Tax=unclassified Streptomyces TaxID=2593676 RepID=UPI000DC767D7|nr:MULTISPECIES: NAD(P)/FAD-dependent oxidoreductase [unclassified Streptomyces]AWZ03610.1 oxidoreductase [Streptomyces sp. ICC4]AWZ11007.1 oxidoreductase [Streptomyces sp. ICC1]